MSHELCKLTMIDSDASVHVCPLKNGQGSGFRKSSETRPLPGAEMHQREMRQMNCDSEAGRVTVDLSCVGHETINLVAEVHVGLGLRCVLRGGPMLDCQEQWERT